MNLYLGIIYGVIVISIIATVLLFRFVFKQSKGTEEMQEISEVASQILCKLKIAQNRIYNFKRVAGGKTGRSFAYIIQENQSMSSSLSLSAK